MLEIATMFVSPGGEPGPSYPHCTIVPSPFNAIASNDAAEIAITLLSPGGTFVCPPVLSPHATTVPSFFRAMLKESPPANATTPLNPGGGSNCPEPFVPQPTIVPSFF